jgi:hypothetical protein
VGHLDPMGDASKKSIPNREADGGRLTPAAVATNPDLSLHPFNDRGSLCRQTR